jgi:exosortase
LFLDSDRERNAGLGKMTRDVKSGKMRAWIVTVVVFGALWFMLIECLGQHWAVEPEYSFGWLAPILGGYLFWLRWRGRPMNTVPKAGAVRLVFCLTALAILPTWLIGQANPDWRVVCWLLASETVLLSLCAIYLLGGKGWLVHFAASICLILAAVPWPSLLERGVVHGLTRLSTEVTVGALNLLRIPALQHGNAIELRSGLVGLDEACSGMQSLQASLMMTLFLGELFRTSARRRSALVVFGVVIAFGCNSLRTTLLCMVAANQGSEAVAAWHDPLGYVLMTAGFLLVLVVSRLITGPLPPLEPAITTRQLRYPYGLLASFGAWIILVGIGTEIWYRLHARPQTTPWSVVWPTDKADFAEVPISRAAAEALLFNEGRGGEWSNGDGSHWIAYFLRWSQGPSWSRIVARWHRPEVCFPAAGYKACGDHGVIVVQVNGFSIPFRALEFEDDGKKQYVFFCLWEPGDKDSESPGRGDNWSQVTRLRSVLVGERGLAQQTLEVILSGYDSSETAETGFRRELANLIETPKSKLVADVSNH